MCKSLQINGLRVVILREVNRGGASHATTFQKVKKNAPRGAIRMGYHRQNLAGLAGCFAGLAVGSFAGIHRLQRPSRKP